MSNLSSPKAKRARVHFDTHDNLSKTIIADQHAMELLQAELAEKLVLGKPSRNQRRKSAKVLKMCMQEKEKKDGTVDKECVICLESIDSNNVYSINASCKHVVYCTSCAQDSLEYPKKYTKCPWCYRETPHGFHCLKLNKT
jgi:hypothetical protein